MTVPRHRRGCSELLLSLTGSIIVFDCPLLYFYVYEHAIMAKRRLWRLEFYLRLLERIFFYSIVLLQMVFIHDILMK